MKERAKRFLTSIVAALTLVSSVPAQAYASELDAESSLISPQDNSTTPGAGSDNAPVVENNAPAGSGTTDGNTATNDTPTADTTTGNSTPIDENDLGEDDLGENDLGEADQDDWDMESEDALILSVEASAFTLRAAATPEINLLAEEDSSKAENQAPTPPVVTIGGKQLGSS